MHISGVMNTRSYDEIEALLRANPQITRVQFNEVEGSIDDEITLQVGELIYDKGLDTYLPPDGFIESGGVDLFCAGRKRIAHKSSHIGVHSWEDNSGVEGKDLPRTHEDHQIYITYFQKVGCPVSFYWYTLNAASADDMHIMSAEELTQHQVVTELLP